MRCSYLSLALLLYVADALATPSQYRGPERQDERGIERPKSAATIVKRGWFDELFRPKPERPRRRMVVSHELELREYMLQHLEQFQHQLWLELEQCRNRKVDEAREDYYIVQGTDVPEDNMAVYYAIAQDACRKELGWSVQQYQRLVELRAAWPARSRGKGGGSSQLHIGNYDRGGEAPGNSLPFTKLGLEDLSNTPKAVLESAKRYLLPNARPEPNNKYNPITTAPKGNAPPPLLPKGIVGH